MVQRVIQACMKQHDESTILRKLLMVVLGIIIITIGYETYHTMPLVIQIMVLVAYLTMLLGVAPIPMYVCKNNILQVFYCGLVSMFLDSFIVILQASRTKIVWKDKSRTDEVPDILCAKYKALLTFAALIGGVLMWFGELYAASLFQRYHRVTVFSGLYLFPPVMIFLSVLAYLANRLPVQFERRKKELKNENHGIQHKVLAHEHTEGTKRDYVEFIVGIILLLVFHNPLGCLGVLVIYATFTGQVKHLIDKFYEEIEEDVVIVLFIAYFAGEKLAAWVNEYGLGTGAVWPIIPAAIQAVLWAPLYHDPTVSFWIMMATLTTGAIATPLSSLVGVVIFNTAQGWFVYMRYSLFLTPLWYGLIRFWIYLTTNTNWFNWLESISIVVKAAH